MISNSLNIPLSELVSNNLMNIKKKEENLSQHIKNIAKNLQISRKSKNLTQREFAKQLNISLRLYVSIEQTLKESCEKYPNLKLSTIFKISNYLKITIEKLLEYKEDL